MTVLEGSVEITAGGESVQGEPGTMVRFEPNERHALRSEGGARVLLLLAPWPGDGHYRGNPPELDGLALRGVLGDAPLVRPVRGAVDPVRERHEGGGVEDAPRQADRRAAGS